MNLHLDLFSGIGGFALAAQRTGWKTIGFSEIEPYACKILKRHWPDVPNYGDIKNVTAKTLADANQRRCLESVHYGECKAGVGKEQPSRNSSGNRRNSNSLCDLITGGFPCQPFSVAGKRRGSGDDRALWPQMLRVIAESKPRWVLGENVAGIISMELDSVLSDLENIGYSVWPIVIPACAVDAKHRRDRVWIVAHANITRPQGRNGSELPERRTKRTSWESDSFVSNAGCEQWCLQQEQSSECENKTVVENDGKEESLADASCELPHGSGSTRNRRTESSDFCQWQPEPSVGRVANGIPHRAHRLKGLGNAIVPAVAEVLLRMMTQADLALSP